MKSFLEFVKYIFSYKKNTFKFKGDNEYNCQFRISFPITGGYKETGIINTVIPAENEKDAKTKLQLFAEKKIKVTVVQIKEVSYEKK